MTNGSSRMSDLASLPMIERLIAFDTTSRNSNLDLIGWVKDYFAGFGIESRLTYDDDGRKANLFATVGPSDREGILLSGHTDVVPVDGQPWSTDPFRVDRRDGRLYGRGTCDMKSFLAVALAKLPAMTARPLTTPIHFALSYDEEVGCLGVPRLIADLVQRGFRPQACIVGEPSDMKVIVGHKGKISFIAHVRGLECHSSIATQGVNAVEYAAEAIAYLKGMFRRFRDQGPHDPQFDPAWTTPHVGTIQGGTALNIVPLDCSFAYEFRYLPGVDPDALQAEFVDYCRTVLEPEMKAVSHEAGFRFEGRSNFPGLDTAADSPVAVLARQLSGDNGSAKVAYGTEAGLFQAADIPTIICGPGSIEQAHKPDEFVEEAQIMLCEKFMDRLIERARGQ
jgi:acetylornithine deacetylase